jgi:hypothetical protein
VIVSGGGSLTASPCGPAVSAAGPVRTRRWISFRPGVGSPLRWAAVVLAAVALCALIGLPIASHLGVVLVGLMVVVAVAVTYFAGRLDKRRP